MIGLASGIYRSASTWCYNVIRIAMQWEYGDIGYGYMPTADLSRHKHWAIKWHDPIEMAHGTKIIHSTRDYQECIESAKEVLDREFTAEHLKDLDDFWTPRADLVLEHDEIRDYPKTSAARILFCLGLERHSPSRIVRKIERIKFPTTEADFVSLFHKGHRRTGR